MVRGVIGAVFCVGLVACQAGAYGAPSQDAAATMSPQGTDGASAGPSDAAGQAMVVIAKERLAGRLDVDVEEITLVKVQPVEWRDASLGCPKPGVDYIQVLTPGYLIKLEAAGSEYEYHTDDAQRVVTCAGKK